MIEAHAFMMADSRFFEPVSRIPGGPEYREVLRRVLPPGWTAEPSDVWLTVHGGAAELPAQGFKIHVSSTPEHAPAVLERAARVCTGHGTPFKVAASPTVLRLLNSKSAGRGSSGKFITVYPADESTFRVLLQRLDAALDEFTGPYILSDRRYRENRVLYYRYGGIRGRQVLNPDGTRRPVMVAPDGTAVDDLREPAYSLPPWAAEPFPDAGAAGEGDGDGIVLRGRYAVSAAFAFTNAGGVYEAVDRATGATVVLKEARPHVGHWITPALFVEAAASLEREYEILRRLEPLTCVPRGLDLFSEWEHRFLVQSLMPGSPLRSFRALPEVSFPDHVVRGTLGRFLEIFGRVAANLLDAVDAVHEAGVRIGDLSPNNVLVEPETYRVSLIDFEGAFHPELVDGPGAAAVRLHTPGFRRPGRSEDAPTAPEDDHYAAGMALYSMVAPVQPMFALDPAAEHRLMERLVRVGLPAEVRAVVTALASGRACEARDALGRWR